MNPNEISKNNDKMNKDIDDKFNEKIVKIINSLPVSDLIKNQLNGDLSTYKSKLVDFLEFQTTNIEDQEMINEWYEVLYPLVSKVYTEIEFSVRNTYYKKFIGKHDFGRKHDFR